MTTKMSRSRRQARLKGRRRRSETRRRSRKEPPMGRIPQWLRRPSRSRRSPRKPVLEV